jgi:hypothetical protein
MLETSLGKKKTQKLLRSVGTDFCNMFMSNNVNAIELRSKEPGICWKACGAVGFLAIAEYSGPNSMENNSPTLFRLRINFKPPPAVAFHLKSNAVRHKLGIQNNPTIAKEPQLILTAQPKELVSFGSWVISWLDHHFYGRNYPPESPIPLIAWGWDDNGKDKKVNYTKACTNWKDYEYLWTQEAIAQLEPWLYRDK